MEPDAYFQLLLKDSDELGWKENAEERIKPASSFLWLSGEVFERLESTEPESMELESKEPWLREVFCIWGVAEKLQVDQRKQV